MSERDQAVDEMGLPRRGPSELDNRRPARNPTTDDFRPCPKCFGPEGTYSLTCSACGGSGQADVRSEGPVGITATPSAAQRIQELVAENERLLLRADKLARARGLAEAIARARPYPPDMDGVRSVAAEIVALLSNQESTDGGGL